MESRLVDLEVRYTHLERQFAELSQVVFEQQKLIDGLQKELLALRGKLGELGAPGDQFSNDPPPHY
jgi:SlyX protein